MKVIKGEWVQRSCLLHVNWALVLTRLFINILKKTPKITHKMASFFVETLQFMFTLFCQILTAFAMWFVPARKKDVRDEIVLITGAGSGIGRLMAFRFASLGSTVVCVDINKQANEATVNEIQSKDQKAFSFTCDCSSKDDIYKIANEIKANVGDVTILINNAGIVSGKKLLDCSDALIQKTFEVNTLAHCWVSVKR